MPALVESEQRRNLLGHLPAGGIASAGKEATVDSSPEFGIFRRYGSFTMAYATLQPGMKYFASHGGYVAYDTHWGLNFVLGDPVAPPESRAAIIEAFVRSHPHSWFVQISKETADALARLGWFVNEFGTDMALDLPSYDFAGPKKSKFRQAAHKIEREGYTIEERSVADGDRDELQALSASWLAKKRVRREARFLVRPLAFGDEPEVRKFYLRDPDGWIVAFVAFDPVCEDGAVIGYSPSIKRRSAQAPTGAEEAITKFAVERFREEGKLVLWLGLMPLHQVKRSGYRERWPLRKLFQFLYGYGDRWVYSFRGHADFKHRYRGEPHKVYYASPGRWPGFDLVALMRLCRIL
jgi:lysylphosphatidylglycerol synthetase-like protein (DUF2156 family)